MKDRPSEPQFAGMLISRIMVTEREPIETNGNMSVGQLIDRRIEDIKNNWLNAPINERPEIHSITFEFPN